MERITEQPSHHDDLETMGTLDLLRGINAEDSKVPTAVASIIPAIGALVDAIGERMQRGGRLFYMGAGTSGRLGVVDAERVSADIRCAAWPGDRIDRRGRCGHPQGRGIRRGRSANKDGRTCKNTHIGAG